MKNVLKLIAVIGVAFALAGCERKWSEEPLVEANFDPELSEYMNKNLPKIDVVQGKKLYMDVHPIDIKQNLYVAVVRVFIDGEFRAGWLEDKNTTPGRGAYCSFSSMGDGVIEYSDAEGYKIKAGKSCYQAKELADFIRASLIDNGNGRPFINTSREGGDVAIP